MQRNFRQHHKTIQLELSGQTSPLLSESEDLNQTTVVVASDLKVPNSIKPAVKPIEYIISLQPTRASVVENRYIGIVHRPESQQNSS